MKKLVLLFVVSFLSLGYGQQFTPTLNLQLPPRGATNWDSVVNGNFTSIDTAIGFLQQPFQGNWLNSVVYAKGQEVTSNNVLYVSLSNNNFNNNPVSSPLFWLQVISAIPTSTSQSFVLAGPSGSSGTPTFRLLASTELSDGSSVLRANTAITTNANITINSPGSLILGNQTLFQYRNTANTGFINYMQLDRGVGTTDSVILQATEFGSSIIPITGQTGLGNNIVTDKQPVIQSGGNIQELTLKATSNNADEGMSTQNPNQNWVTGLRGGVSNSWGVRNVTSSFDALLVDQSGNMTINKTGATLKLTGATSGTITLAIPATAGSNTITIPAATDQLVGRATTDNLINKNMQLGGNGNTVTLLNAQAAQGSATTGNGADQTLYTFTIPANTVGPGKCIHVKFYALHVSGTASTAIKVIYGATAGANNSHSTSGAIVRQVVDICNNAGVQNTQFANGDDNENNNSVNPSFQAGTGAENFANAITVKGTFNVAATDTWEGKGWYMWLDQ